MDFYELLNYSWNVNGRHMSYWQFYVAVVLAACGWLIQLKGKIAILPAIVLTLMVSYYFSTSYGTIKNCYMRNHEINEEIKHQVDALNLKNENLAGMLKFNHAKRNWRNFRRRMIVVDLFVILLIWYRSEPVVRLIRRYKGRARKLPFKKSLVRPRGKKAPRIYALSCRNLRYKRMGNGMDRSRLTNTNELTKVRSGDHGGAQ